MTIDVGPEWIGDPPVTSCSTATYDKGFAAFQHEPTEHNLQDYMEQHYGCLITDSTLAPVRANYPFAVAYFGVQLAFFAVVTAVVVAYISLKDSRRPTDIRV